jgi:hypothetical protein
LITISDLEAYIKKYKHLPKIPSAEKLNSNGQSLGEMQNLLLEKVEELSLYIIQLEKRNTELEERMSIIEQNQ